MGGGEGRGIDAQSESDAAIVTPIAVPWDEIGSVLSESHQAVDARGQ